MKIGKIQILKERDVLNVRSIVKKICSKMGFNNIDTIKITTISSELTRNIYEHASSGEVSILINEESSINGIEMIFKDQGPGIYDLKTVLNVDFISKKGMGVGLLGAKSLMDEFNIESSNKGTKVSVIKWLKPKKKVSRQIKDEIITIFSKVYEDSTIELIKEQNQEFIALLTEMKEKNKQLVKTQNDLTNKNELLEDTSKKLEESNRSIKLYSEKLEDMVEQRTKKLKRSKEKYYEAYHRAEFYKDLFAHDINNILQGILSGLQVCEIELHSPNEINRTINFMKSQVMRGAKLVSNIKNLSKLEESEIALRSRDVCKVLKKSITSLKNFDGERSLNIQFDFDDKNFSILGNDLLEEVFDNILNNAIKHNKNPTVEIKINISKQKRKRVNYLKMEFLDNGKGVSDTRKEKIFTRGYKEITSIHGVGLGLSLVKKIIETYNGEIWVEDRVKGDYLKGSNFILLIPEVL